MYNRLHVIVWHSNLTFNKNKIHMKEVLTHYGFDQNGYNVTPYGSGLINNTWIVEKEEEKYILQRVNENVFKTPEDIAANIELLENYLQKNHPDYFFTAPHKTLNGKRYVRAENGFYRAFPFVKNSFSFDVVEKPELAYEAARQFGRITKFLSGIDMADLKITLPSFHDLSLRYKQFLQALQNGNRQRIEESADFINRLNAYSYIAEEYERIKENTDFKLRVTHHDTKISNILFDSNGKGICVIDLDTVMPGYFISDVGDMMRTYLCPVSEEEKDYGKIEVRDDFYKAIVTGYKDEMGNVLTEKERQYFFYAGTFMIYMQALRFLTDYLNNDIYYGSKYQGHNFVRAGNQITLLEKLIAKKQTLG